ncbi:hypothetical protein E5288_WYG020402 [Bos mutus]|uniref:Uncharacterized protein n=1 Tax=Bos mutus TaxID=72004 RepID=A0A6B0RRP6_9CETA|nr:hypothetical protein [Bos mutus]
MARWELMPHLHGLATKRHQVISKIPHRETSTWGLLPLGPLGRASYTYGNRGREREKVCTVNFKDAFASSCPLRLDIHRRPLRSNGLNELKQTVGTISYLKSMQHQPLLTTLALISCLISGNWLYVAPEKGSTCRTARYKMALAAGESLAADKKGTEQEETRGILMLDHMIRMNQEDGKTPAAPTSSSTKCFGTGYKIARNRATAFENRT